MANQHLPVMPISLAVFKENVKVLSQPCHRQCHCLAKNLGIFLISLKIFTSNSD